MPQMMPMFWSLMLIFSIFIILTTTSFFFFTSTPNIQSSKSKLSPPLSQWSWMW